MILGRLTLNVQSQRNRKCCSAAFFTFRVDNFYAAFNGFEELFDPINIHEHSFFRGLTNRKHIFDPINVHEHSFFGGSTDRKRIVHLKVIEILRILLHAGYAIFFHSQFGESPPSPPNERVGSQLTRVQTITILCGSLLLSIVPGSRSC